MLRCVIYANCIVSLAAIGVMLTGRETGQYNLALAGLLSLFLGLVGWAAGLVWLVIFLARDIWATRDSYRLLFGKVLNLG